MFSRNMNVIKTSNSKENSNKKKITRDSYGKVMFKIPSDLHLQKLQTSCNRPAVSPAAAQSLKISINNSVNLNGLKLLPKHEI